MNLGYQKLIMYIYWEILQFIQYNMFLQGSYLYKRKIVPVLN
jgi:hypothetical protein